MWATSSISNSTTSASKALTRINSAAGAAIFDIEWTGREGNSAGLIPTAMVSSMFGQLMPGALEKLKQEAPQGGRRTNGS